MADVVVGFDVTVLTTYKVKADWTRVEYGNNRAFLLNFYRFSNSLFVPVSLLPHPLALLDHHTLEAVILSTSL